MKTLILVRHGSTVLNDSDVPRIRGFLEVDLNTAGKQQAEQAGEFIHKYFPKPTKIYTSPMNRAKQTTEIIQKIIQAEKCEISLELNEVNWGKWEGMTYFEDLGTEDYDNFKPLEMNPPDGETLYLVKDRARQFLNKFIYQTEDDCILAVSHGSVISIFLCEALQIPLNKYWTSYLTNGGIGVIQYINGNWIIKQWGSGE